jgi:hypothetical protein
VPDQGGELALPLARVVEIVLADVGLDQGEGQGALACVVAEAGQQE